MNYVALYGSKPAVVSMSLGGGASSLVDNAVRSLFNRGFFVSVAAGNSNDNACNYSPARSGYVSIRPFPNATATRERLTGDRL